MTNNYPWPTVCKNEYVDIIAPSGTFSASDIVAINDYLIREGFRPRIPKNILGDHPFAAQSDSIRFELLKNALTAEDSTLLWCVRGGHGVTRIMPDLIQLAKPKKQKLLVGFSDISSLHLWLNQAWEWPSLQGPSVRQAAHGSIDTQDMAALQQLWFDGLSGYSITDLQPINKSGKELDQLEAITTGGCISVLQTSIGTPWQLDAHNKILFLEDINEAPYRIDRLLVHLTNAGILQQTKAIVFGDFGEKNSETTMINWVLNDLAEHYFPKHGVHAPIFRLHGFGHGPRNQPLPFGVNAQIKREGATWRINFLGAIKPAQ